MSEEMGGGMAAESTGGDFGDNGGDEGMEAGSEQNSERGKEKPKAPQPKKPVPKMRQVKVNGRVEYVDEDAVIRDYQKYKAADERLRTAAQKEAEAEKLRRQLEEDPDSVFKDPKLSGRRRELAMKWLEESIAEEVQSKDPRDAELEELRAWKKQQEDLKAEEETKAKEAEKQKFVETRKTAISQTLRDAMEASQLSAHPESAAATLREMAVYMRAAREAGEEVTADELVQHIHNSRFQQMYTLAHQFEGDELIDFLGEEIVNRIRKADLDRIRKRRGETPVQSYRSESFQQAKPSQGKFIDPADERFAFRTAR